MYFTLLARLNSWVCMLHCRTPRWGHCPTFFGGRQDWAWSITGGSCHKYNFCRDKNTSSVATKVCLLRQNFCHDKIVCRTLLLQQKTCFVATKVSLLWQKYVMGAHIHNWFRYSCAKMQFLRAHTLHMHSLTKQLSLFKHTCPWINSIHIYLVQTKKPGQQTLVKLDENTYGQQTTAI